MVVIEDRPAVGARYDHERAVVVGRVVEHDADGEHVVVRVRIERPVLVPLDRGA